MPSKFHRIADARLIELLDLPIHNGHAPELQAKLGPAGYPLAVLDAALAERNAFAETLRQIGDFKGQALTATHALRKARAAFHTDVYMPHVGTAQIALRDDHAALVSLGLHEPRARTDAAWTRQTIQFYENARQRPSTLAALALRGLHAADLDAGRAGLDALETLDRARDARKAEAKTAVDDRKKRRAALVRWLSDFRATARIALRDTPEWLERLGIGHRSGR